MQAGPPQAAEGAQMPTFQFNGMPITADHLKKMISKLQTSHSLVSRRVVR